MHEKHIDGKSKMQFYFTVGFEPKMYYTSNHGPVEMCYDKVVIDFNPYKMKSITTDALKIVNTLRLGQQYIELHLN